MLIYNTSHDAELEQIEELGGVKYQFLSHRDEAGKSLVRIKDKFKSELHYHEKEASIIAKSCESDVLISERTSHISGIEIIPTPGHTDGSTSFLYHSPHGRTYLFTGDTLFRSKKTSGISYPD